MEEVEANKLVEDDSASRPGVGIGAGVGAAASVVGPSRLPEVLAAKWQAADTQVRLLLTHRSLHCTNLARLASGSDLHMYGCMCM